MSTRSSKSSSASPRLSAAPVTNSGTDVHEDNISQHGAAGTGGQQSAVAPAAAAAGASLQRAGRFPLIPSATGTPDAPEPRRRRLRPATGRFIPTPTQLNGLAAAVSRRGAMPPLTLGRPPVATTVAQRADRLNALRNMIAEPVSDGVLRLHLSANGWDVNLAALAYRQEAEAPRTQSSGFAAPVPRSRLRRPPVSQARVRTVQSFRRTIEAHDSNVGQRQHTAREVIGLLVANDWDTNAAIEAYQAAEGDLTPCKAATDQLRSRRPNQRQRDQRLADFLTMTDLDNVADASEFLEARRWDVARALDAWYGAGGVLPEANDNSGFRNNGFRAFREATSEPDSEDTSSEETTSAASPSSKSSTPQPLSTVGSHDDWLQTSSLSSGDDTDDEDNGDDKSNHGFIINHNPENRAKRHCPDPTQLLVEKIVKGQYKYSVFNKNDRATGKVFRFNDSDHESDSEKVEMDWKDPKHISQVNSWRRQIYRRANDPSRFGRREAYSQEEHEFIWDLHAEHLEEVLGNDPDYFRNGGRLPLTVTRQRIESWANRFNARFANQNPPRPTRTPGSIEAQRHRIAPVTRDFQVPENVAHPGAGTALTGKGHGNVKGKPKATRANKGKRSGKSKGGSDGDCDSDRESKGNDEGKVSEAEGSSSDEDPDGDVEASTRKRRAEDSGEDEDRSGAAKRVKKSHSGNASDISQAASGSEEDQKEVNDHAADQSGASSAASEGDVVDAPVRVKEEEEEERED